jgi:Tfp pilus assembly protein PilP
MAQEQDIQELLRAFEEYNKTLKSAVESKNQSSVGGGTETPASKSFDKSTTKIVAALGVLNSSVLASSKTEVAKKRDLEKFIKKVDETTDAAEKLSESLEKTKSAVQEAYEKSKKADDDKVKLQKKQEEAKKKQEEADEKSRKEVSDSLEKFGIKTIRTTDDVNIFGDAARASAKAMEDYLGALYKGQRGMAVAAKPMTDVFGGLIDGAKTFLQVLTFISPWGRALSMTSKAIMVAGTELLAWIGKKAIKAVDASAEQLDALYKAYGELSVAGAGAAGGLSAVRESAQSLGFTMAELDDYSKLVTANSKNIKMFGVTVADGTKTLANMFQKVYNSEFGTELENMGIFQKEQRENALAYMEIQARTGNLQKANAKGLVEFNRQLDLSAAMTGAAREEAKQADLASKADPRLQAARRVAVEKDDKQEIARIDAVTKAARLLEMIGDKGAATGARQFGAGGYAGGQGAIEAARQYGINNLKGGETEEEIMKMMREASVENRRLFDNITRFTGPMAGLQTADAERAGLVEKTAPAEQAIKEGKAKDYSDFYKQEQEKRAAAKDVDQMNTVRRTQQETAMIMDNSVNIFKGIATTFADSTAAFAKAVADFAPGSSNGKSWNKGGYSPSSGGGQSAASSGSTTSTTNSSGKPAGGVVGMARGGGQSASPQGGVSGSTSSGSQSASPQGGVSGSTSSGTPSTQAILDTIKKRESGGDYQVQAKGSTASGAYQFIDSTWRGLSKKYGIGVEFARAADAPANIQDSVAAKYVDEILKQAGGDVTKVPLAWYTGNIQGKISDKAMAVNGGLKPEDYQRKWMDDYSKIATPQARNGGIFKGPTTGYNVELHGEEAVVPMNGGKNVTKQALPMGMGNDDRSGEMISLLQMLIGQNETVISLLDSNNDYSKKLVSVMS